MPALETLDSVIDSDRYEIKRELGRGCWGIVYAAKDLLQDKEVAIKVMHPNETGLEQMAERELNEFTAMQKEAGELVACAHIVPRIFMVDRQGKPFIVMPKYQKFFSDVLEEKKGGSVCFTSAGHEEPHKSGLFIHQIITYARDIISGLAELHKIYRRAHCDLKPDNLAVDEDGKILINDMGTSTFASLNKRSSSSRDNMGCLYTRAPELFVEGTHPQTGSDVWAVGSLLYKMFTGEYVLQSEIDKAGADVEQAMQAFVDEQRVYTRAYREVIERKLSEANLPAGFRKFIEHCLLEKYSDGLQLNLAFKDALPKPGFWKSLCSAKSFAAKVFAAGLAAASLFTGAVLYQGHQEKKALETLAAENSKPLVTAAWNGGDLEISNTLAELGVRLHSADYKHYYPDQRYLDVKPGDRLSLLITMHDLPRPRLSASLPFDIQYYLEGFTPESGSVYSESHNQAASADDMRGMNGFFECNVPADMPPGDYVLAIEAYVPKTMIDNVVNYQDWKSLRIANPTKALARKRIPLVVGGVQDKVDVDSLRLGIGSWLAIGNIDDKMKMMNKALQYCVEVPELGYNEKLGAMEYNSNIFSRGVWVPNDKGEQGTLCLSTRTPEGLLGCTFFPIERIHYTDTYADWDFALPDRSFADKLVEYRKQILAQEKHQ